MIVWKILETSSWFGMQEHHNIKPNSWEDSVDSTVFYCAEADIQETFMLRNTDGESREAIYSVLCFYPVGDQRR